MSKPSPSNVLPASPADSVAVQRRFWDSDESVRLYAAEPRLEGGEARVIAHFFQTYHTRPARVLDLGCGAGRTTGFLAARGADVVGIDLAPRLVQIARARYPAIRFDVGNAESLPFADGEFDAVFFIANGLDCLPDTASRQRSLREISRVLKPGGRFMSSHHNMSALLFGWYRMLRPWKLRLRLRSIASGKVFKAQTYISDQRDSGGLMLRYAWPSEFVRELRSAGFEPLAIFANDPVLAWLHARLGTSVFPRLMDPWPTYAFAKTP